MLQIRSGQVLISVPRRMMRGAVVRGGDLLNTLRSERLKQMATHMQQPSSNFENSTFVRGCNNHADASNLNIYIASFKYPPSRLWLCFTCNRCGKLL